MWLIKCSGLRPDVETREARLPLQHTPHQGGLLLQDDLREILPASMISLSLSTLCIHHFHVTVTCSQNIWELLKYHSIFMGFSPIL